jgi:ATPase family associated with various cellular activities (AAA)/AAA+ lid domain
MPPPGRLYVQGSPDFHDAVEKGFLHTSGPPPKLNWPPSLGCAPSSSPSGPMASSSSPFYDATNTTGGRDSPPSFADGDHNTSPTLVTSWSDDRRDDRFFDRESGHEACHAAEPIDPHDPLNSAGAGSGSMRSAEASTLDEIVGHDEAKIRVQEVLLSLSPRFSAVMTGIRALPPSILLYGPPGCGKVRAWGGMRTRPSSCGIVRSPHVLARCLQTKLARAIAGEAGAAFLPVAPSDIMSKYVGESEGRMREIFTEAWNLADEVDSRCAVVFFDEIDAIGQARGGGGGAGGGGLESNGGGGGGGGGCSRRVLTELLLQLTLWSDQMKQRRSGWAHHQVAPSRDDEMDDDSLPDSGCDAPKNHIIVVAATNRFEDCDQALLRRFGIHLHIGLPSNAHRETMVQLLLHDVSHALAPQDLQDLASMTNGWSGSDLESLTREAAMAPVRECIRRANEVRKRCQGDGNRIGSSLLDYLEPDVENLRPVVMQDFILAIKFFGSPSRCPFEEDDE